MNERIRELVRQAVESVDIVTGNESLDDELAKMYIPDCFAQKFAELIVKECIGIVENSPSSYGDYRDQISNSTREACVEKMKQQFEIAEQKGWVCPKCGVDRIQAACPKGHTAALTGECPMVVTAQ
jgi:hypothetical protein